MDIGFLKVTGEDGLVRDPSTNAILNTNNTEYQNYLNRRAAARAQKEQIEKQGKEIEALRDDISDIKQMLSILIDKR